MNKCDELQKAQATSLSVAKNPRQESKLLNLCVDCAWAIRWVEETYDDLYSYKRNGHCFNKHSRCALHGEIIDFHAIVKCNQYFYSKELKG